ncbi:MAG: helix-turn-helix domain-containing protein [Faecousia sp.]
MAVCYDRLFHLLIDKRISNAQLKEKAGFSANIITRLKRNEYVSMETVERICTVLDCSVDDILKFSNETAHDVTLTEE